MSKLIKKTLIPQPTTKLKNCDTALQTEINIFTQPFVIMKRLESEIQKLRSEMKGKRMK